MKRYYRVAAFNDVGTGPYSQVRSATTTGNPATAPSAPTRFRVSNVGSNQLTIAWAAPEDDGGAPVTGYEWQMDICAPDDCNHDDIKTGTTTGTSARVDLGKDGRYLLGVRAINGVGAGRWAYINQYLRPSTGARVLVSPTTLTVDEGSTASYTIRLTTDPADDYDIWSLPESGGIYTDVDLDKGWAQDGPTDWSQGVTVTFTAPEDSDAEDDVALIRNWVQMDCNRYTDPADRATCKLSPYSELHGASVLVTIRDND